MSMHTPNSYIQLWGLLSLTLLIVGVLGVLTGNCDLFSRICFDRNICVPLSVGASLVVDCMNAVSCVTQGNVHRAQTPVRMLLNIISAVY
jgi:hypothetical protein